MSIRRGTLKSSVLRKAVDIALAELVNNSVGTIVSSTSTTGPPSPKVKEEVSSKAESVVSPKATSGASTQTKSDSLRANRDNPEKSLGKVISLPALPKLAPLKNQTMAMVKHENSRFATVGFAMLNLRMTDLAFREFPGFKDEELQQLIRRTLDTRTLYFFATVYKFLPLLEFSNSGMPPRSDYANEFMTYVGQLSHQNEVEAKKFVDRILIQVLQNFRYFFEKHGKDFFHPKDYKRLTQRGRIMNDTKVGVIAEVNSKDQQVKK